MKIAGKANNNRFKRMGREEYNVSRRGGISTVSEEEDLTTASPPLVLWRWPWFWRREMSFILTSALFLEISFLIFWKTWPAEPNALAYLTGLLLVMPVWGVCEAAAMIARIEVDRAIVDSVNRFAEEALTNIDHACPLWESVENYVAPNDTKPELTSILMFKTLFSAADRLNFEPDLNKFYDSCSKNIFDLQNLQNTAMRIGIIGTFVGLLLAMYHVKHFVDISGFAQLNPDSSVEEIGKIVAQSFKSLDAMTKALLKDLYAAFNTSIIGLETAVMIGFLIRILRKKEEFLTQGMVNSTKNVVEVLKHCVGEKKVIFELRGLRNLIVSGMSDMESELKKACEAMAGVEAKNGQIVDNISNGMDKLTTAKSDYDKFIKELSKTQTKFLMDVRSVYEFSSLTRLTEHIKTSIGEAGQTIAGNVKAELDLVLKELPELKQSNELLQGELSELSLWTFSLGSDVGNLKNGVESLSEKIHANSESLDKLPPKFDNFLNSVRDSQSDFVKEVGNIHSVVSLNNFQREIKNAILDTEKTIFTNGMKPHLLEIAKMLNTVEIRTKRLLNSLSGAILWVFGTFACGVVAFYFLVKFMLG